MASQRGVGVSATATAPLAWGAARDGITWACAEPAGLARALGAMGLYRRGVARRGDVPGFAPDYAVFTPWRARMVGSRTEAGRGFAQGAWPDDVLAARDAADALERARIAEHNRALRDREVFVLRGAAAWEGAGLRWWPRFAGVHIVTVTKQVYAMPRGTVRAKNPVRIHSGARMPAPVGRTITQPRDADA